MNNQHDNRRGGYGGHRPGGQGGGQQTPFQAGSGGGQSHQDARDDIKSALQSRLDVRYRDEKEDLRPSLLDEEAQAAAKALENITNTQLRRFFAQVGAIKRRIDVDPSISDSEILAQVAFLKASSAYAAGRSTDNKPVLDFVVKHANSIKDRRDFLDFHRHFEAVIAFHKVYGKDKKGN